MKRKIYYAVGVLTLLSIMFVLYQTELVFDYNRGEKDILVQAFNSSGAAIVETNINSYAASTDMFLDQEEVTETVKSLALQMGVDFQDSEKVENFNHDYNQLSIIGKNKQGDSTVIIVHSMDFTDIEGSDGGFETNIVVDVTLGGGIERLSDMQERVKAAVEEHIQGVRATLCIIGSYADNIPEDSMEGIINSVFQTVDALEVERAVYDGLISISAYTPRIGEYIEIGGNRINLNVAMRYNSFEGRTYIWLGSPVISLEY